MGLDSADLFFSQCSSCLPDLRDALLSNLFKLSHPIVCFP